MSIFIFIFVVFSSTFGYNDYNLLRNEPFGINPGPSVYATKGEIWPLPQEVGQKGERMVIDSKQFEIHILGKTCDILEQAVERYQEIIKTMDKQVRKSYRKINIRNGGRPLVRRKDYPVLKVLQLSLINDCEPFPYLGMDEKYTLAINTMDVQNASLVISHSIWGILRGLESFVQSIFPESDSSRLIIRGVEINDYPRFTHRGLLIDTSRHFIPLRQILTILDGMAMNKLNVFHWHIVDDQSFPYESAQYPELSQKGAYSALHVYTAVDVANIIEYARIRGIRVLPEFDSPGHTRSWGIAYPELLTTCYNRRGQPDGSLGPMNPLNNFTYLFMDNLLSEIQAVFKDKFVHLGGDEVPFECWLSNPELVNYMVLNKLTPQQLEEIFVHRIIDLSASHNLTPIVWQEVYDNGVRLPKNTVIHVWKDWTDYMAEISNITHSGYTAILSSCWYLDHLTTGGDWVKFYECDPTMFPSSSNAHERVLGGEACMWAEVVDPNNVLTRIFPRASAAAEKLWSPSRSTMDYREATPRLEEHYCKMNMRGVPAQPPNGPGFCPFLLYN